MNKLTVWYDPKIDTIYVFDGESIHTEYAPGLYVFWTAKACSQQKSHLTYIGEL